MHVLSVHTYDTNCRTGHLEYAINPSVDIDNYHEFATVIAGVTEDTHKVVANCRDRQLSNQDRLQYVVYGLEDQRNIGSFAHPALEVTADHIMSYLTEKMQLYGAVPESQEFQMCKVTLTYVLHRGAESCAMRGFDLSQSPLTISAT